MKTKMRIVAATVAVSCAAAAPSIAQADDPDAAKARAVTRADLNTAYVPSLCRHHPGHLRHGELPGIPDIRGYVALAALTRDHMVAFGKVKPRTAGDAAAVVSCNAGGVPWPDNIELYAPGTRLIGNVRLLNVFRHSPATLVHRITIKKHQVKAQVTNIGREGDASCCGSAAALLTLRWKPRHREVRIAHKQVFTEKPMARKLIRLVRAGRTHAAEKYATPRVVRQMSNAAGRLVFDGCYGQLDPHWPGVSTPYTRFCAILGNGGLGPEYGLFVGKRTWKAYKGYQFMAVAG